MNINKWFAEQCGVELWSMHHLESVTKRYCYINGISIKWTLKDPCCMQVVREKFHLITTRNYITTGWECHRQAKGIIGKGKTIPEAEYACCEAIYNARGDRR